MINQNEFYSRIKNMIFIPSSTGKATYSSFSLQDSILHFKRDNKNTYWKLNIDELYTAYTKENFFDTVVLRKHLTGRIFSPALAILKNIKVCDEDGYRKK